MEKKTFETLAVQGSYKPDSTGATNPPIYLSNAYQFHDTQHAADLFDLKALGYIYTRLHNPTTSAFEETMAQLEDGVGAVATSSGHFAIFMAILTIAKAGDEIVSSNMLYGGTLNLFASTFKRMGINVLFADHNNPSSFEKLITDKTRAIFLETIPNPSCDIPDFEAISKIAKKHKVPFIVDNTCAPYLMKAKDFGADIVIYSSTKFLGGHGDVMGGIVIDLGTFDWKSGRFNEFCTPDESYHGVIYAEAFGNMAFAIKMRTGVMRDVGGNPSPFNSYELAKGLKTLALRVQRHSDNALMLAKFLKSHKNVEWVNYPLLEGNKNNALAKKYLPKGAGSILTFGIKGGLEAGRKFIESAELPLHVANIGDVRTIVTHPASTTHRQLSPEGLAKAGITQETVRVSVGIENIEDIKKDFDKALNS